MEAGMLTAVSAVGLGVLMMSGDDVLTEPVVRRIEVFTGAGRRRRWSPEAKARIVAESYALSVGDVADRYGLAKTQLFSWRREARLRTLPSPGLTFAPVVVDQAPVTTAPVVLKRRRRRRSDGGIELEIDGVVVRIGRGAGTKTVAAVIGALKARR
jgi:transposase